MKKNFGEHLRDVTCGFGAYVGARLIWGPEKDVFRNLPIELLTFASLWILLQVLLRGWRYVRQSKKA